MATAGVAASARALVDAALAGDTEAAGWLLIAGLGVLVAVGAAVQAATATAPAGDAAAGAKDGGAVVGGANGGGGSGGPPPMYSEGLPLLGNIIAFMRDPLALVRRGHAACGGVFTIRIAHKRMTFLLGAAPHAAFFRATDEQLDQTEVYRFSVPVFGRGVVYDAPLPVRLQQFRLLSLSLRVNMLETYVPMMVGECVAFFDAWADEGEVELFEALSQLIILTASRCLMGREIRENLFGEVSRLIHDLDEGMQPLSVLAPYLPTPAHARRDAAREELRALYTPIIKARRAADAARAAGEAGAPPAEDDMLQTLLESRYRDGRAMDDNEVVGMLVAALFAGQHTSSITSTWTGLELLRSPTQLAAALAEQDAVRAAHGEELTYASLGAMDVLHRAMKETLRMYPPLIFLLRKVLSPRPVNGYTIPVGDVAMVSTQVSGRLPELFDRPDVWDPERFAPGREEDRRAPFSYLGFGGGRHGCMGEGFAYLQVKTIWAVLLRTFELTPVGPLPPPDFGAMVVGPKGATTIRYRRRVPRAAAGTA